MPSDHPGSVLLVGASRGLGAGLIEALADRGWQVTATVRDRTRAAPAKAIAVEEVDIDRPEQVAALHEKLADRRFDLIFVVAGVGTDNSAAPIHQVPVEEPAGLRRSVRRPADPHRRDRAHEFNARQHHPQHQRRL